MQAQPSPDTASRILMPWDGQTPLDQLLICARAIGGQDAELTLLPLAPGLMADDTISIESPGGQAVQRAVLPPVEQLNRPDDPADPAPGIATVAAKREVDLILMVTACHPAGELAPSCLAAQLALDSPIPVMVVHFDCDAIAAFPRR